MRSSKTACLFIMVLFFISCAPTVRNLPSIVPARLGLIDSRVYTSYLENAKEYEKLVDLLSKELSDIELTEVNVRDGIYLAEWEKNTIN